jgi:dTDP-4-dehydrorhamnose reductase
MRILVTGASGLIGSNLVAAAAQQSWSVLGAWRTEPVEIRGASMTSLDICDRATCVAAATTFDPDVVVHAASVDAPGRFEREAHLRRLCVLGVENTLAAARTARARYVLVSCDWVFGGPRAVGQRWDEGDTPQPVNAYGRALLAAEELVREASVRWLITRVADVYGVNMAQPRSSVERRAGRPPRALAGGPSGAREGGHVWERSGVALRLVSLLREGRRLGAPMDVYRSPTYAWDYAQRACELIAQRREGVYHMAGPDSVHRREYARLLARAFGADPKLVEEGSVAGFLEACGEDPRLVLPANTALDGEKAHAALGHPGIDVEAGLWLASDQLRRVLAD